MQKIYQKKRKQTFAKVLLITMKFLLVQTPASVTVYRVLDIKAIKKRLKYLCINT